MCCLMFAGRCLLSVVRGCMSCVGCGLLFVDVVCCL